MNPWISCVEKAIKTLLAPLPEHEVFEDSFKLDAEMGKPNDHLQFTLYKRTEYEAENPRDSLIKESPVGFVEILSGGGFGELPGLNDQESL